MNVVGPHALTRVLLPFLLADGGVVLDISSDAAVEHYETWGGYAASKAALDRLALTLGSELSGIRAYAFDPGDMRTAMHQEAFPGEDISDRPLPDEVAVPAILRPARAPTAERSLPCRGPARGVRPRVPSRGHLHRFREHGMTAGIGQRPATRSARPTSSLPTRLPRPGGSPGTECACSSRPSRTAR